MRTAVSVDYTKITEMPGTGVTEEQVLRLYQRYFFAAQFCKGKDVLEAACGGGVGLGLLSAVARSVTASDLEPKNLERAKRAAEGLKNVKILMGDAQKLPLPSNSFDVVILYEAIYYLPRPDRFFSECRRVLRPGGVLIIGSANREWKDFNPSAFSTHYFSASELKELMEKERFQTELFIGFPVSQAIGIKGPTLSFLKRLAVKLHLIPKSMKYKKILKRFFMGKLVPLPSRLTQGIVEYLPPQPLSVHESDGQFKVIYVVGKFVL